MKQLDLLPPTAAKPRWPTTIVRSADIDGDCRWSLRRAWGPGPPILWVGYNPSNANAERDDPTMWREIGFSFRWGYGSLIKFNMYPFISSKPADLRRWLRTERGHDATWENINRIRAELPNVDAYVAAWGAGPRYEEVRDFMMSMFWDRDAPTWQCLGLTREGAPKHTLARGKHRIPDDATLVPWEFEMDPEGCK